MSPEVYIISDAIGSGKTTALKNWVQNRQRMGGFLTPKIEGKRFFEFIPSGEVLPMEADDSSLTIGKYQFDAANFQKAEEVLWNSWIDPEVATIVIDEIGPLELKKQQGFHSLLLKIKATPSKRKKTLMVVVRNQCLQDFIERYTFQNLNVLTIDALKTETFSQPVGLVLCGGESRRMRSDKALLKYHAMPQWDYVRRLMHPFCQEVLLSVNAQQKSAWAALEDIALSIDQKEYIGHGPMTGVLSAVDAVGEQSLLVVACDYPLLRMEHILELFKHRSPEFDVVCYKNKGQIEPLVTLFEISSFQKLKTFFENGNDSMATFIGSVKTRYITVSEGDFLKNVNRLKEFQELKSKRAHD